MTEDKRLTTVIRANGDLPEVTRTFDEAKQAYRYQYGINPYAIYEVSLSALKADVDGEAERVGDWLERLDRLEAGA